MIFRSVSRPHEGVYSCPIRSGIFSAVILEKSWKLEFFDPPKHHENMLKMYGFTKKIYRKYIGNV